MADPETKPGKLGQYREKRSAERTPEPFGGAGSERPGLFVVQKHAARNLHFDLRIEVEGVLKSWALPKGPSLDPQEKRMAFATEDHPVEYADFEGIIPQGNYGAGAMIVWDRGMAIPHIDHRHGLEQGKLLFELRGYKLRGLFTLVKTKKDREWLLIKKPDQHARAEGESPPAEGSVFSGLTVEELRDGHSLAPELRSTLEALGAPRHVVDPAAVQVSLCERRREPFSGEDWLFEIKYDGYRLVAAKTPTTLGEGTIGEGRHRRRDYRRARLFFRSGLEASHTFPELVRALSSLPFDGLVVDGEVVALDDEGRPSFSRLQRRGKLSRLSDVERATVSAPVFLFLFDFLGFEDFDLRPLPLLERKRLLRQVLPAAGPLRFVDHILERGEDFYAGIRRLGLEGMVAKRARSPYIAGRSPTWLKIRAERTGDFVIVGYTLPDGPRGGLRALHVAALDGPRLVWVGKVGTGFSAAQVRALEEQLEPLRRDDPAAIGDLPRGAGQVWVEPRLVAEIRFIEMTASGHLRHPVFARLRDDKRPEDCLLLEVGPVSNEVVPRPEAGIEERQAPRPEIVLSNLEKVFWPEEGYTKGDLVAYYEAIAPWLLPYLRDRPVVLDRYPDGIDGKSFFQKNAPDFAPEWLRTEAIWSEETGDETLYFVCDNLESLLYLVNLGSIPFHIRSSRLQSLQAPDWCVLDLDAKDAPFSHVIEVARAIHQLCTAIGLPAFAKTSGATGMHVLLPMSGQSTHEQGRMLGELLARLVVSRVPEIASVARSAAQRPGQVYVDFLQNGYGKLLVAPFSARPRPGATVSMPLRWSEVEPGLDPGRFTIRSAVERLQDLGEDPLLPVMARGVALQEVLIRLSEEV